MLLRKSSSCPRPSGHCGRASRGPCRAIKPRLSLQLRHRSTSINGRFAATKCRLFVQHGPRVSFASSSLVRGSGKGREGVGSGVWVVGFVCQAHPNGFWRGAVKQKLIFLPPSSHILIHSTPRRSRLSGPCRAMTPRLSLQHRYQPSVNRRLDLQKPNLDYQPSVAPGSLPSELASAAFDFGQAAVVNGPARSILLRSFRSSASPRPARSSSAW